MTLDPPKNEYDAASQNQFLNDPQAAEVPELQHGFQYGALQVTNARPRRVVATTGGSGARNLGRFFRWTMLINVDGWDLR